MRQLFDQSVFVRASINGVVREALIAALLTGMMILLFLGSWRSTVIVCISIPLSILTSLIVLSLMGQTINVMTLGGLALAVGILVDDATVEIENTHRNMAMRKPLVRAVLDGAQQIAVPAFVSTLSICIVFVPVLLLTGAAKYLFTPLAMAVVFAMLASYLLSRTLIPTMVHYMLKPEVKLYASGRARRIGGRQPADLARPLPLQPAVRADARLLQLDCWTGRSIIAPLVLAGFGIFVAGSLCLARLVGSDFFPTVDSGQMRLHARAPAGTRIEKTELIFADIEREIRDVIPAREIDTIIDNIGIPNGGFNLAFGDSRHYRHRRWRHPDFAQAGRARPHGRIYRPAPQAAAREISRHRVLLRGGQYHQPDSELRASRAHRRAGRRAQRRGQLCDRPATCRTQIARIPGRGRRPHASGGGLSGDSHQRGSRQGRRSSALRSGMSPAAC